MIGKAIGEVIHERSVSGRRVIGEVTLAHSKRDGDGAGSGARAGSGPAESAAAITLAQ
ncbi:hypothetical protein AB0L26_19900 [Streptomyces nondiastaticus]|uniref:hypothetical protein n=1 Tax=Streptomyces nondiastaticus TaxID=3154512 RepID=UPI00341E8057